MNLNYSDDQIMFRDSVQRYLGESYSHDHFRKIVVDPEASGKNSTWKDFAELGWLAMPFSEKVGGLGGGHIETSIVCEQLGRHLVVEPFIHVAILAGGLVETLGSEEQCEALLKPLMDGKLFLTLAHYDRRTQGDAAGFSAKAKMVEDGYRLTADKTAVVGGASADTFLITAAIHGEADEVRGTGVFIVPRHTEGLDVQPYRMSDGSMAADVRAAGVLVGPEALLGNNTDAFNEVDAAIDRATAALCWDAVGAMDALLIATVEFTKQRVQFGRPLSSFQALQHRMAEMSVKCTEARASALLASLSVDARKDMRVRGVSGAKTKIGRVSRSVAQEAIQLHGAMGFTDEVAVGWWFKRLFVFENLFGSTGEHLTRYAALIAQPSIQAESLLHAPD